MNSWLGPLLMVGQQLCFALENAVIHGLNLSLVQLSCLRDVGGTLLAVCLLPTVGLSALRTPQFKLQIVRGLVSAGYLLVLMYSLANMPLADAVALSQTQALYIVLFGYAILGERVGLRRGFAVVIGLAGALVLINPEFSVVTVTYLVVLIGSALNALAYVLNRYLQARDHSVTVMFYTNLIGSMIFLPLGLAQPWPAFDPLWLVVLGIGPLGMYLGIIAVRITEVSILAPYTYTRLVAIAAIAPLVFNEPLTPRVIVASLIIVAACVMATQRV